MKRCEKCERFPSWVIARERNGKWIETRSCDKHMPKIINRYCDKQVLRVRPILKKKIKVRRRVIRPFEQRRYHWRAQTTSSPRTPDPNQPPTNKGSGNQ